jgi:hypothetical protein
MFVVGQRHVLAALPHEKRGTHFKGDWACSRAGQNGLSAENLATTGVRTLSNPERNNFIALILTLQIVLCIFITQGMLFKGGTTVREQVVNVKSNEVSIKYSCVVCVLACVRQKCVVPANTSRLKNIQFKLSDDLHVEFHENA